MKIRHGMALLLALAAGGRVMAQQRTFYSQKSPKPVAVASRISDEEEADQQDTVVPAPNMATIGSPKGTNPPGGDYGLGQPLCSPQISLSPKSNCTRGQHWWYDPCGFASWGCGTPVRTAYRNTQKQLSSLIPCGPWCQSKGCNCSGQGPYAMDWSQPDRRSCECDCKGSHYLFPWIWNYNPSRGGYCWNRWTQRGDGYRSALQFNADDKSPEFPYEEETPAPPPSVMDEQKTIGATQSNGAKMRNVSLEKGPKKPATAVVQEVAPTEEDRFTAEDLAPKKPKPTGALSANYLARLAPKTTEEEAPQLASPSKQASSRRR